MVETTLLKEPLTSEMIDIGARLTEELNRMGVPVTAAFWLFESESNNWLLRIASPEREIHGSRAMYERIAQARKGIGLSSSEFPLTHVSVIESRNDLVRALQAEFKHAPVTTPLRFGRGAIQNCFVDDAYIYRVN